MKIGVISDIHADLDKMWAALTFLEKEAVDRVVCAGDIVEKGRDGDAVVRLLRAKQIPCVRGNHDSVAPSNNIWLQENAIPDHPMLLTQPTLDWLQTLPPTLSFTWEGTRVLVAHGTPASEWQYLHPHNPPRLFFEATAGLDCDVLLLGHTHQPMMVHVDDIRIFNPGSICGGLAGGSMTCGILTVPEKRFTVYDYQREQRLEDIPVIRHVSTNGEAS